jgi:hypothetical protein
MGSKKGGFIGKVITPGGASPDASASGVWNMHDVVEAETSGIWPQPNNAPSVASLVSDPSTIEFGMGGTQVVTFSGATDVEDSDTALLYEVINISNTSLISVAPSSDNASPFTFTFTSGSVSADTGVTFDVRVTDQWGLTATKNFSMTVLSATVLTISSNTNNYDIGAAVLAAGGDKSTPVILTINSGVTVGSTSSSTAAMYTGTGWSSGTTINITNNGSIVGFAGQNTTGTAGNGGNGGSGGWWQACNGYSGSSANPPTSAANNGGDAFNHSQTGTDLSVIFDVTGTRVGGGAGTVSALGGGGGGGTGAAGGIDGAETYCSGGGGGGGAANGGGGYRQYGNNGANGTSTSGGAGGAAESSGAWHGGYGGSGGNPGASGGASGTAKHYWWTDAASSGGGAGSSGSNTGSSGVALTGNTAQIS